MDKKKILLVDDAQFSRNLLKKVISKSTTAEVCGEASNGNEALEQFQSLKPDMVTMDLVMPEKGGIDTIEELLQIDPSAKIVVVSALGQEALVLEAAKKGAKDFIQKPFKDAQILDVIDKVLIKASTGKQATRARSA
ncbi:MAG TPA: response regulator [Candidatus Lokiarchaeia archaeon]|nr:response regulator [Candidatus Lokiarchaeia archaeon]